MSDPQQTKKPGAMTMAMQAVDKNALGLGGPKILKIGLIQDSKLVEEKDIRTRETVTVGASEKNHFIVAGLPGSFKLFELVGNDYFLNFTDEMNGKVSLNPGPAQELSALRTSGAARNAGSHWVIKLSDISKGRVVVGGTPFLFQFVTPPPQQPKPQLPAGVIGGFGANVDWVFAAYVMSSLMFLFFFVIFLEYKDFPVRAENEIPARYAELVFQEPEPPKEEKPVDEGPSDEVAEDTPSTNKPSNDSPSNDAPSNAGEQSQANSDARIAVEEAASQVEQLLLGAFSSEGGALADALAGGAAVGSSADLLAQSAGVGVATNGTGTALRERSGGGSGDGVTAGLGAIGTRGGNSERAGGGAVTERQIRGRANMGSLEDESGSGDFDPSTAARAIKTRLSAIKGCYERGLRGNPTLKGKVVIKFTIQTSGSVSGVTVTENTMRDDAVGSCIRGVIAGLRFNPGPEGGSVTYAYPFVFEPSN